MTKTNSWAVVTLLTVILTAASMVWVGWFGSTHYGRAAAAQRTPQVGQQARPGDPMNSQAAWRYRRNQSNNWKLALAYHH